MQATAGKSSGNHAEQASRSSAARVQARLSVGPANDKYEQEADNVADKVVGQSQAAPVSNSGVDGSVQRKPVIRLSAAHPAPRISRLSQTRTQRQAEEEEVQTKLQRQPEEKEEELQTKLQRQPEEEEEEAQAKLQRKPEEEKEEAQAKLQRQPEEEEEEAQAKLQRKASTEEEKKKKEEDQSPLQAKKEARANVRDKRKFPELNRVEKKLFENKGKGEKLDDDTRITMETGLGADLKDVSIHKGGDATDMNRELRAQAFTHGKDVFFNQGKYEPDTVGGRHLLAHELTHVVQQGAAEQKVSAEKIDKNNAERLKPPPEPTDKKAIAAEKQTEEQVEQNKAEAEAEQKAAMPTQTPAGDTAGTEVTQDESRQEEVPADEEKVAEKPKAKKPKKAAKKAAPKAKKKAAGKAGVATGEVSKHLKKATKAKFNSKNLKISQLANNEKKKETPETKLKQTEKAVVPPAEEAQSRSNASQVETVETAPAPQPDEQEARQELNQAMENAVPSSLEEADKFKEEGKGRVVGEVVKSRVTADTQEVQTTYQQIEETPEPQPPEQEPETLPETEQAPETPVIDMGEGVVGETLPEHSDLSEFESQSDDLMKEEGIKQEQLEMVDEGELAEAKNERKSLKTKVKDAPAEVKQEEEKQKQQTSKELQKEELDNKQQMRAKRKQALKGAQQDQHKTKSKIELKRQQVTDHINGIYQQANDTVKQKLETLEKQALKAFDEGEKQATKNFEDSVERRMNAFKRRRYDRIGGSLLWAKDKLFGMDDLPEVKNIFDTEKTAFVNRIDALIKTISAENKRVIQECRELIATARQQIDKYVAGLGPELRETGQTALKDIKGKLDALDQEINNKEQELKKKLEEKREAAIKAIEEKIEKMKEEMSGLVSKLGNLLLNAMVKFFKWALKKAGYASDKLMGIINKGKSVIKKIVTDPVGFIKNIISAVKNGIGLFSKNIKKHLVGGLVSWLTGAMADVPIQLPAQFDLKGILSLVLQILGLTWNNIRTKLVKKLGERVMGVVETSVDIVKRLISEGPMALWKMIKEKAAEIKTQVMEGIRNWVITNVIKQGIIKLLSFLNPAGAIVQAILAIYNTVMFFVENWQRIVDFVKSVFDSIGNIAMGRLSAASAYIERVLGMTIPIIMNFLSRLLGLSGIGKAVSNVIKKIRRPIDKIINKIIDKIEAMAKKLFKKSKSVAKKVKDKVFAWLKIRKVFTDPAGQRHSLSFQGSTPAAKLMVKSSPKTVPAFVTAAREHHKGNAAKLKKVDQIKRIYEDIAKQQRLSQRNKTNEAIQKETGKKINALMDQLSPLIASVFPSKDVGTQSNPYVIDWPKRASVNYSTLYFGPKTNKWIPQETLKAAKTNDAKKQTLKKSLNTGELNQWKKNGYVIEDYKPEQLEALPGGGPILGISSEWRTFKGKKFILKPGKTTGGRQLNAILKQYGFRPSKENQGKGMDADHILEMQLGGKNLIRNLWPLAAPENRSSGSIISTISLKNKKNNEKSQISTLKEDAKKRPVWVEIERLKANG